MDAFIEFLLQWGYLGLFIGACLPLSADLLMAGLLAVGGDPVISVLAATLGNWTAATTIYYLCKLGKWKWLSRLTKIKESDMERYRGRVAKYGAFLGLAVGIPAVGDFFGAALGFFRVPFLRSGPSMFLGKLVRFAITALLYYGISPVFS